MNEHIFPYMRPSFHILCKYSSLLSLSIVNISVRQCAFPLPSPLFHRRLSSPLFYRRPYSISFAATVFLHQTLSFVGPRVWTRACVVWFPRPSVSAISTATGIATASFRPNPTGDDGVLNRGTRFLGIGRFTTDKRVNRNPFWTLVHVLYSHIA